MTGFAAALLGLGLIAVGVRISDTMDRRFDGGTDEELLDLFKRNKRVLARNDEDVIAAMTRPR